MSHVTKIAAVETATAIWEYDPSLEDNRVLNGSLDVISAIRTLAIKVSMFLLLLIKLITHRRSSRQASVLSIFRGSKLNAVSSIRSRSPFMETHVGAAPMACSIAPINCDRYAESLVT
jgi:hypothetical protein